jgi:hypothetical protein
MHIECPDKIMLEKMWDGAYVLKKSLQGIWYVSQWNIWKEQDMHNPWGKKS